MSTDLQAAEVRSLGLPSILKHELDHLAGHWLWIFLLGVLLVVAGIAAVAVPPATVGTTLVVTIVLGAS